MYYAQRKEIKNGAGQTPSNYYYETKNEAERQYHLLCANALANSEERDVCEIEYGTLEYGIIERKCWDFRTPVVPEEPEPEET